MKWFYLAMGLLYVGFAVAALFGWYHPAPERVAAGSMLAFALVWALLFKSRRNR